MQKINNWGWNNILSITWPMRKLFVHEWKCLEVWVGSKYCSEFIVKVWVHQGSVLGLLLFAVVMEAISIEYCIGCFWKLLYADYLIIAGDSMESLKIHFKCWKSNLESKGLKIKNKKTKILIGNYNTPSQVDNSKYPCGVCSKVVCKNSIYCNYCKHLVHQHCTDLWVLREDPDFKCRRCRGDIDPPHKKTNQGLTEINQAN